MTQHRLLQTLRALFEIEELHTLRYSTTWPMMPRPVAASTMMHAQKPSMAYLQRKGQPGQ